MSGVVSASQKPDMFSLARAPKDPRSAIGLIFIFIAIIHLARYGGFFISERIYETYFESQHDPMRSLQFRLLLPKILNALIQLASVIVLKLFRDRRSLFSAGVRDRCLFRNILIGAGIAWIFLLLFELSLYTAGYRSYDWTTPGAVKDSFLFCGEVTNVLLTIISAYFMYGWFLPTLVAFFGDKKALLIFVAASILSALSWFVPDPYLILQLSLFAYLLGAITLITRSIWASTTFLIVFTHISAWISVACESANFRIHPDADEVRFLAGFESILVFAIIILQRKQLFGFTWAPEVQLGEAAE